MTYGAGKPARTVDAELHAHRAVIIDLCHVLARCAGPLCTLNHAADGLEERAAVALHDIGDEAEDHLEGIQGGL